MLSIERARELFRYDPETGKLYWKVSTSRRVRVGDEVGAVVKLNDHVTHYRLCRIDRKNYLVHRVIWLLLTGAWPEDEIDHIDRDGLNNRPGNLRDVPSAINQANKAMRGGGVYLGTGGTWIAEIKRHGKRHYLGSFASKDDALEARKNAEVRLSI
jgi:hypothetical protein